MITAGKQTGTVLQHKIDSAPNTGSWCVNILFELDGGADQIGANVWLTDKAMGIARKSLKAIGFDVDKQNVLALDENPTLLAGNKCELDIRPETYNGETSLKVAWINPIPEPKSQATFDKITDQLRKVKKTDEAEKEDIPF